jgi:hypothetical protein
LVLTFLFSLANSIEDYISNILDNDPFFNIIISLSVTILLAIVLWWFWNIRKRRLAKFMGVKNFKSKALEKIPLSKEEKIYIFSTWVFILLVALFIIASDITLMHFKREQVSISTSIYTDLWWSVGLYCTMY